MMFNKTEKQGSFNNVKDKKKLIELNEIFLNNIVHIVLQLHKVYLKFIYVILNPYLNFKSS